MPDANLQLEIIYPPDDDDIDPAMKAYQSMKNQIAHEFARIWEELNEDEADGTVIEPLIKFDYGMDQIKELVNELMKFCYKNRLRLEAGPGDPNLLEVETYISKMADQMVMTAKQTASVLNHHIPVEYQIAAEAMLDRIHGHAIYKVQKEGK